MYWYNGKFNWGQRNCRSRGGVLTTEGQLIEVLQVQVDPKSQVVPLPPNQEVLQSMLKWVEVRTSMILNHNQSAFG